MDNHRRQIGSGMDPAGAMSGTHIVDELDLQIIGALQTDGRKHVAEISRELDIPKSTVQRRLDALIRDDVIRIAPYANSERLGLSIHVHLNLRVELANYESVIDAVGRLTEVRWLAVTTGPYDLVAEAYFVSSTHLHEFIRDRLATIPGITGVETSVILSVEKLAFHWDALLREARRHAAPHVRMATTDGVPVHRISAVGVDEGRL